MEEVSRMLRALADPTRLRILNILSQSDACVCELQSVLDVSQPFISRHLACLRNAGLVRDRREGARVYYSLVREAPAAEAVEQFLLRVTPLSDRISPDLARLSELRQSRTVANPA
jgi:ArsR family transcriptional regulator, arsenate/arsenite/antimonite-responsive transcriptional repressor